MQPVFPQVVVFHGPAGGVGKTLIALHLAYLYAKKGCTTVLVDLSQYGAVAAWLRLPRGTSSGLAGLLTTGNIGTAHLQTGLVSAPGAGDRLHLVLSSGPAKMDQIKAGEVEAILRQLAALAQVVIVDTGSELTERTLGALLAATHIALTVSPKVITGWQTLELIDLLRSAHVGREQMGVVFSRVQSGSKYGVDEYEQVIGLPTLGIIPEAADLLTASERGGPPNIRTRGPGMRALRQLAHQLVPIFGPKELKRSWPWSR